MNLGREIVTNILDGKKDVLKKFLDAGFDTGWLNDPDDLSRAAIFGENDLDAYKFIVDHFLEKRETPSESFFRRSFPAETYKLADSDMTTDELLTSAKEDRYRVQLEVLTGELIDHLEAGRLDAAGATASRAAQVSIGGRSSDIVATWDDSDYDLEGRAYRNVQPGIGTGIPEIDDAFAGWQPGDFVIYLGKPKAGKTSFFIKSALHTYNDEETPRRVMFVSVEIPAGDDVTRPGIMDRLDAFTAGISYADYSRGWLPKDKGALARLRAARAEMDNPGEFKVIQPTGSFTIVDLENHIERLNPDVVYVDGFYLMTDVHSGEGGGSWKGQDNLAKDMKMLAMRRNITILASHQVRTKQLQGKKKEIDSSASMGGTALNMWATTVMGIDIDEDLSTHTVKSMESRIGYLPTVRGTWDWDTCTFNLLEEEYESKDFEEGF